MKTELPANPGFDPYGESSRINGDAYPRSAPPDDSRLDRRRRTLLDILAARLSFRADDDTRNLLRAWTVIVVLGVIDRFWADRAGLTFVGWRAIAPGLGFIGSVAVFYDISGRNRRLAGASHYVALWVGLSIAGCILTYLMATLRLPLRDADLARIDAALGFDWFAWSRFVGAHPLLRLPLAIAYASFLPQIIGSVMWFSHIGRDDRNRELLWAGMLSLLITAVVSGLLPALGPFFPGHAPDWSLALLAIRDGTASKFALGDLKGIITMPSFHTVMAILLIYSHRPPVRSFSLIAILNVMMLLGTPAAGHHYLIDMIAGAAVAALSIAIVRNQVNGSLTDCPSVESRKFRP